MVDKETIEEAVEMTKDIPATDQTEKILTPIIEDMDTDTNHNVKVEVDIIRGNNSVLFAKDLARKLEQGWQTVGSTVPVSTSSGIIFFQTVKRVVAVSDEPEIISEDETN